MSEAERAIATELERLLIKRGPLELSALLQLSPVTKAYLRDAPMRLAPLCQLFPEQFVLEPIPSLQQLRLRLRRPDEPKAEAEAEAEAEAAASDALCGLVRQRLYAYHQQRPTGATDPVPLPWIMRAVGSATEVLVAASSASPLLFHLRPAAHGYPSRLQAWWGCLAAHLQRFALARPNDVTWHAGQPCTLHHEPTPNPCTPHH